MNYKKGETQEIFVKSFGAYSFSLVVLWLISKYEIDAFVLESHAIVLIIGVMLFLPLIFGVFIGGFVSVIGMLAITFEYFESYQKEIDPSPRPKWYYQIICFLCAFVFAWMLIVLGEKVLDQ